MTENKRFVRYGPMEAYGIGESGLNSFDTSLGGTGIGIGDDDEDEIKVEQPIRNTGGARVITDNGRYSIGGSVITVSVPQEVGTGVVEYIAEEQALLLDGVDLTMHHS